MKACVILLASLFVNNTDETCLYRVEPPPANERHCYWTRYEEDQGKWGLWLFVRGFNEDDGQGMQFDLHYPVDPGWAVKRTTVKREEWCL